MSVETYTRIYDEVVIAMQKVQPNTKFVGMALAARVEPHYFEYFLDPKNHKPGDPLDFISYHFYANAPHRQTPDAAQYRYLVRADRFLKTLRFIGDICKRPSPSTKTTIGELGVISADDGGQGGPARITAPIPNSYWNLAGASALTCTAS
jgi:hypothetical protein